MTVVVVVSTVLLPVSVPAPALCGSGCDVMELALPLLSVAACNELAYSDTPAAMRAVRESPESPLVDRARAVVKVVVLVDAVVVVVEGAAALTLLLRNATRAAPMCAPVRMVATTTQGIYLPSM